MNTFLMTWKEVDFTNSNEFTNALFVERRQYVDLVSTGVDTRAGGLR